MTDKYFDFLVSLMEAIDPEGKTAHKIASKYQTKTKPGGDMSKDDIGLLRTDPILNKRQEATGWGPPDSHQDILDWLYTQSEDSVAADIWQLKRQIAALNAEFDRLIEFVKWLMTTNLPPEIKKEAERRLYDLGAI